MMQKIILVTFHALVVAGTPTYLYLPDAENHPVREYTVETNRFFDSTAPRVVEFYSPSCPACVEFKSHYIRLATETTERFPEIEFYAVSCDDHLYICQDFNAKNIPSLKVYKEGEKDGIQVTNSNEGHAHTMNQIFKLLGIDEMGSDNAIGDSEQVDTKAKLPKRRRGGALHAKYKPNGLNRFRDFLRESLDANDKLQSIRSRFRYLFRGKKQGDPIGHGAESDTMTRAMKVSTPGTKEFKARRKALNERLQNIRKRSRKRHSGVDGGIMTLGKLPYYKETRKRRFARLSEEEALILDVTNSFIMGLKYGIFLKSKKLTLPQLNSFRNYLDLLSVSLPSEWRLHKLILKLRQNYVKVGESRAYLLEILDSYPSRKGWSNDCTISGFSCGFWKLLHTATVGIAENRGGLNLIDSGLLGQSARTFSPIEAADTIRDYIDNFFTCGPCREEFIANYDECDNNRRCDRLTEAIEGASIADWKELATWLWEVHNEVSLRILKTRAERMHAGLPTKGQRELTANEQIQVLWPQMKDCIACFKEDGSWNEASIFAFMESKYWHGSEIDPKYDRLLKFEIYDESSSSFLPFAILFCLMYVLIRLMKRQSGLIQNSFVKAKQLASTKTWQEKKSRFQE